MSDSTAASLNQFLAEVEKRAFAMTMVHVKNADDALDIVQDAMMTLARRYADKPADEWPPLFFRILRNRTTDFHRSRTVRQKVFGWLRSSDANVEPAVDPVDLAPGPESIEPDRALRLEGLGGEIIHALEALPERQREAFMLRTWEGLDVAATAAAMGCSQGSVKTHYSRAVRALRLQLEDYADG